MPCTKRQLGFSLIELLIAVTLITSTIALTNLVYANYVANDIRFAERVDLYSDLPEITDKVRAFISQSSDSTGSEHSNNTHCDWQVKDAKVRNELGFDMNTGKYSSGAVIFTLSTVELSCKNNALQIPPFEIKVLSVNDGGDIKFG